MEDNFGSPLAFENFQFFSKNPIDERFDVTSSYYLKKILRYLVGNR
jgi:hypothetical protein